MFRKSALAAAAAMLSFSASAAAPALSTGNYVPTRTILQTNDVGNMQVIMAVTEIAANMTAARHTHPGVEISYLLEGECDFTIEGLGVKHLKAGDSFRLESGVRHSVKNGPKTTKILAVYTIPKGAALATPAPE